MGNIGITRGALESGVKVVAGYPGTPATEIVEGFLRLDQRLHFMQMLRGLNAADSAITSRRNVILIISESDELEMKAYRSETDALMALFHLEKERPESDIVLVKGDTSEDVRVAFKNYFSDAGDFIRLMDHGCEILSEDRVIYVDPKIIE